MEADGMENITCSTKAHDCIMELTDIAGKTLSMWTLKQVGFIKHILVNQ